MGLFDWLSPRPARQPLRAKRSVTWNGERGWAPIASVWPSAEGAFSTRNDKALAEVFSKLDIVYMCVNELASAIAGAPLQVCMDGDEGPEPVEDHDALRLFYENPDYSASEIFRLITERLSLTGAAFSLLGLYKDVLGAGEFTPLPTHRVKRIMRGAAVLGYEFARDGGEPLKLKPEEVCAIVYPDPAGFGGYVSPLQAAARAVNTDQQRADTTFQVLRNKALPGGFIETEGGTTKPQRDELTENVNAATGAETSRRGSIIALPKGCKFVNGVDVKDVDFSVLNALAETRICGVFQVPPIVIGAKVGLDMGANYASYEQARKSFYKETIVPLWNYIADGLTRAGLLGNPALHFTFDTAGIAELQEDQTAKVTRGTLLYEKGLATLNEARAEAGLPAVETPDGDEFKAPPPAPVLPGQGEEEGPPFGKSGCTHNGHACTQIGHKAGAIGRYDEAGPLESAMRHIFGDQRDWVSGQLGKGNLGPFDLTQWDRPIMDACRPSLRRIYEARVRAVTRNVAARLASKKGRPDLQAKAVSISGAFDIVNEAALKLLERQLLEFAKTVNDTTGKNLDAAIEDVIHTAQVENAIPALKDAVAKVFVNATDERARMIAVTESSRATHDGGILAAARSGVVKGFMPEVSSDACETCLGKIGQYVPLAEAEADIGQYEDRGLPPWHPNDRCTYTEVLDIDEEP